MRMIIELMAFGSTFSASLASPAATPTISVPPNANTTPRVRANTGVMPIGNRPPLSVMLAMPAWASPTGAPVTMAQMAMSMNATMVVTLMAANQNSASPNIFTLSMFSTNTNASAISASSHCGTPWNAFQ